MPATHAYHKHPSARTLHTKPPKLSNDFYIVRRPGSPDMFAAATVDHRFLGGEPRWFPDPAAVRLYARMHGVTVRL